MPNQLVETSAAVTQARCQKLSWQGTPKSCLTPFELLAKPI